MEQRDSAGSTGKGKTLYILDTAEQFLTTVAQGGAEHPELGQKDRTEIAGMQRARGGIGFRARVLHHDRAYLLLGFSPHDDLHPPDIVVGYLRGRLIA